MVPIFAVTVFLSAALLFVVQPMMGKMLLPLLGGAPAAWNTCLVFFQAALLAGYAYAHLVTTRLGPRPQVDRPPRALAVVALAVLPVQVDPASPVGRLSATEGPRCSGSWSGSPRGRGARSSRCRRRRRLLQRWLSRAPDPRAPDPYVLYAASDLGSLLALLELPDPDRAAPRPPAAGPRLDGGLRRAHRAGHRLRAVVGAVRACGRPACAAAPPDGPDRAAAPSSLAGARLRPVELPARGDGLPQHRHRGRAAALDHPPRPLPAQLRPGLRAAAPRPAPGRRPRATGARPPRRRGEPVGDDAAALAPYPAAPDRLPRRRAHLPRRAGARPSGTVLPHRVLLRARTGRDAGRRPERAGGARPSRSRPGVSPRHDPGLSAPAAGVDGRRRPAPGPGVPGGARRVRRRAGARGAGTGARRGARAGGGGVRASCHPVLHVRGPAGALRPRARRPGRRRPALPRS